MKLWWVFPFCASKQVLEAFFRQTLAREKGSKANDGGPISLSQERDGVYVYQSGQDTTIMLEGHLTKLPLQQVRLIAPTMKGFSLVMIHLNRVSKYTIYHYSLCLGYKFLAKWSGVHSSAGGILTLFSGSYGVANSGKVLM